MKINSDDSMKAGGSTGLRKILHQINMMSNSPWGNAPKGDKDGSGTGNGNGGGDKEPPAGPRNPWSNPRPENPFGGNRPSGVTSLEELLKKARQNGGGGGIALVGLCAFFSMVHIVPPEKEGVVTTLGSYSRTVGPGVKFTLPPPLERIRLEDVRAIRTMAIGSPSATDENFVLTRDQSIVDLAYEVRWTVSDPAYYFFQIANPEETIREVAESAMRATVANFDLVQAIGPGRVEIEAQVQQRMQDLLNEYHAGVTIQGIAIRQADPPSQVDEAFKEVTASRQERESAINLARAYEQQVLERARGDTAAFDQIYEQYKLAPRVTRQRLYYETMENVLSQVDKTIVEPRGVTPYLPLNEMQRRAAPAVQAAPATKGGQ
jgi:modulator of FtsH protease HflK